MEKDKIFFDESGFTTTSANHISNLAKEAYQSLENKLASVKFYTREVRLLSGTESSTLEEGQDSIDVESDLLEIAQLKSLIAWLREAIKAKDNLINEARNLSEDVIAEVLGIEMPARPKSYTRLTEDDVVATWGIKQRNRFYYVDTLCSTFGKYIHPNGDFARAKEDLLKALKEPRTTSGSGRDMVIFTKVPTISVKEVEDAFFNLQKRYRAFQSELNAMKHQIEVALQADDVEKSSLEVKESSDYSNQMKEINAKIRAYRNEEIRKAQNLKIILPDSLQNICQKVQTLGK